MAGGAGRGMGVREGGDGWVVGGVGQGMQMTISIYSFFSEHSVAPFANDLPLLTKYILYIYTNYVYVCICILCKVLQLFANFQSRVIFACNVFLEIELSPF